MRNAFLTQRLHPIAPVSVTRDNYRDGHNYVTRENYDYLLASAERYAGLLGKKLHHDPGISTGEGIANLYRELDKLIGGDVWLNIETDGERLVFVLWNAYRWGKYNYYWLPVGFVEELNPQLRRLAISFLHQFSRSNGLYDTNESDDFEMMVENFQDRSQDKGEDDPRLLARLAADYSENGKVGKLMKRIERRNYHKRLAPVLDKYTPQSAREAKLIMLMRRGLEFIGTDKPSILSYTYDPLRDEKNDDYYPVFPHQTIRLTYDVNTALEAELRWCLQEEAGNGYEVQPCATLRLTPDTDAPFAADEYPTRFYKYMDDLLDFLTTGPQWTQTY